MGAGASTGPLDEREEKFFAEMQKAYDEYKPQESKMEREDSFNFFKSKIELFLENEAKSGSKESYSDLKSKIDDFFESKAENKSDSKAEVKEAKQITRGVSSIVQPPSFYVGDIVKAKVDGMLFEGVVIHNGDDDGTIEVDFGDDIEKVNISDCSLVMSGLDFEVGDLVQARTAESFLYCHGKVLKINHDGTFDILFDGDDDDDVERNIPHHFVRKHRTGRAMVKMRWHRAKAVLATIRAFNH